MHHGLAKYIIRFFIGILAVVSFFLIREFGFYIYVTYIKPIEFISRKRDLYYAIWLASFFIATPLILFTCLLDLKLKGHVIASLIFILYIFTTYMDTNPIWGMLLMLSYLIAMGVSLILSVAANKILIGKC